MKKLLLFTVILAIATAGFAQTKGKVTIIKDPLIDSLIAKRIQARIVPTIRFYFDKSLDEGIRMANLVETVRKADEKKRIAAGQEIDVPAAKAADEEE